MNMATISQIHLTTRPPARLSVVLDVSPVVFDVLEIFRAVVGPAVRQHQVR